MLQAPFAALLTPLFVACLLLAGCASTGTSLDAGTAGSVSDKRARIDQNAPAWLAEYDVPSVAVAYIEGGEVVWVVAHGEQAPGVPATTRTLYNVASMTKPVSAETVLRLASHGEISLDEPMSDHWVDPDLEGDPRHRALTARIALWHQTGFANWRRQTDGVLRFQWDPGTQSGYSGEGYEYVARFAEATSGEPFDSLAERLVLGPTGMDETAYTSRSWFEGRVAVPQGPDGTTRPPAVREEWMASDDLHTTAGDYARFVAAVMGGDGVDPTISARRYEVRDDQAPLICGEGRVPSEACPQRMGFGLGWLVFDYGDETVVMHGGGDWGERAVGFFVPERQTGAVILTNGANGMKVIRDVATVLLPGSDSLAFLDFQAR